MKPETALKLVEDIRRWLKAGATIQALNPEGCVLEEMKDGKVFGGISVILPEKPREKKCPVQQKS